MTWIKDIVVPVSPKWREFANDLKEKYNYSKVQYVDGMETRHESIYAGLKSLSCKQSDIVIVHDAVRPFLKENFLLQIVNVAREFGASGAVRALLSTVVKVTEEGFMEHSLQRSQYRESHTPQGFQYELILKSYLKCSADDLKYGTECLNLVHKYCGVSPKLVDGPEYLWKVTHKKDLLLMESYIRDNNLL